MIRGWYHSSKNGKRLLSIDEIAGACCTSSQEVKKWIADKIQKPGKTGPDFVDAAEVVWFLVRNGMPVSALLLPPKTKKILFIANDEYVFQDKCDQVDIICRFFASHYNILVETSTAGRFADLNILTFSPDWVIIFHKSYSKNTIKTLNLLARFPEQKAILFVDNLCKDRVEQELGNILADLIVSDALPTEQLLVQLRSVLDN
ncbi:MAG: hypothetical protein KJ630_00975 [Proteobacteria bacterium]|nr:hypothetical protein [Pseudomonadota bacterium]